MTLPALEQDFDRHVRTGDTGMLARVVGDVRGDAATRLGVYAHAYRARLHEVLESDFPGVQALAGHARFRALTDAYVDAHPSTHFNARWFGHRFAEFLEAHGDALAELARLEWAMTLVFDHADEPVAGVEAAAAIAPERWGDMHLVLVGALRQLELRHNSADVRHAVDQGAPIPASAELPEPAACLAWRKQHEVYTRVLAADEAAALASAQAGHTFGQVCEALGDDEGTALRAAALLRRWLEDGLVRELRA